ncbi:hypothetical protein CARUB_v10001110mg [Capsella rubella]|uniref:DUF4005 domain-containing protein n=1 Tax=Capsella rubella TaxID=81985 RepID=R0FFQ9_9BRAS|nr:protein IQ-DOMAIN 14 [Capsella rubella]EOA20781.1 hypothetical protein CARUB_v10001110mg [Capsella rubella]
MGFFGRLFGSKKQEKSAPSRRRWSFTTNSSHPRNGSSSSHQSKRRGDDEDSSDADKHAIAVAAATAAVAEAALAAARAAAEVVRLTNGGRNSSVSQTCRSNRRWTQEYRAARKIQSAFRGYLARRALRALKALVKLQALVKGHIVRKQTADMLRRMQTLVRLQARARASRSSHVSDSFHSSTLMVPSSSPQALHARRVSEAEYSKVIAMDHNHHRSPMGSSRLLDQWRTDETLWNAPQYNEDDDKILEVDTWKPHLRESPRKRGSLMVPTSVESSPQLRSRTGSSSGGSRRKTPFTPTRSEYEYYSGYHPNYMANTESYRAKVRSQSAPRQRLQELSSESGYKRSIHGQYYYYAAAAERSFDQRSDNGISGYRGVSDGLDRNQSEKTKMYTSFFNSNPLFFQ